MHHKKMQALLRTSLHLCHGLYMIFTGTKSSCWENGLAKSDRKIWFIDEKEKKNRLLYITY
jgi:hypothetical protein